MGHYVYKYVLNDEIIYIGKNDTDLVSRLECHGRKGDNIQEDGWTDIKNATIYYVELANSIMADVFESEMIKRYKPKYNKAKMSDWDGLPFAEPEWKLFAPQKEKIAYDNNLPKYMQAPYTTPKLRTIEYKITKLWDLCSLLLLVKNENYVKGKIGDIYIPLHEFYTDNTGQYRLDTPDVGGMGRFTYNHKQYWIFDKVHKRYNENTDTIEKYLCSSNPIINEFLPFIDEVIDECMEKISCYILFLEQHYPCFTKQKNTPFIAKYNAYTDYIFTLTPKTVNAQQLNSEISA